MKLYEIAETYNRFMQAVEDGDVPEECIEDTLEAIQGELEDKVDNIACLIKSLVAETEAMKAEKKNLEARMKAKANLAERLKAYVSETMRNSGINKIETVRKKLSFRKSSSLYIEDENEFIAMALAENEMLIRHGKIEINKEVVKEYLGNGVVIPGAEIRENYNLQIK